MVDDDIDTSSEVPGFVVTNQVGKGEFLLRIPGDLGISSVDVAEDDELAPLAEGRSELVGLALFLMKHRSLGAGSPWRVFLDSLPRRTDTPVLWADAERAALLRGSPILEEARAREKALGEEWDSISLQASSLSSSSLAFKDRQAFFEAMSVVLSHATFLPSAQCFALLPLIGGMRRTGSASGATLDYDFDTQSVVLVASRPYSPGQEVRLFDGRPSGEVLLAMGTLEPANPADYLTLTASLVPADRLYTMKQQILEEVGFGVDTEFPVFPDRIATQHLAFLRLSRLTDVAQFAKVTFEHDVIISPENEYEILQLLMGDLREKQRAYATDFEEDVKELQRRDLTKRQRLAGQLRLSEKRVLRGTMDGVRRRLAPIRGIPTKDGALGDPNADFKEMFDVLEAIPTAPKKLFDGLAAWARGENDPDWNKKR